MDLAFTLPIAVACIAGAGFAVNEWSHGAMAEAVGLGHHHALDHPGGHCVAANGTYVPAHGHMAGQQDPRTCAEAWARGG